MNKKLCDKLGLIFLCVGIIILPLLKGHFGISKNLMTVIICGITLALILLIKLIGYKTAYSQDEIKADRINFIVIFVFLIIVFVAGFLGLFG